jgi:hypothetical protein
MAVPQQFSTSFPDGGVIHEPSLSAASHYIYSVCTFRLTLIDRSSGWRRCTCPRSQVLHKAGFMPVEIIRHESFGREPIRFIFNNACNWESRAAPGRRQLGPVIRRKNLNAFK